MNLSRHFIVRPVATILLMMAILVGGAIAHRFLPLSALPQVDYPIIQVTTLYPGAGPDVTSASITAPLERQLGRLAGLNQIASASAAGSSVITLQFGLDVRMDTAEQDVQAAINAASNLLPGDLPTPPIYSKVNPADAPVMTLAVTSSSLPLTQVEDIVDTRLAQKISQINGVGLVTLQGGQRRAVRVQANPVALASYGMSLEDLRTAISNANVNGAKGSFDGPSRSYAISANDQLRSPDEYGAIVVATKNGAPVMLRDVARVIEGPEDRRLAAWKDDTPAIIVSIQRQPGSNVVKVVDDIKAALPHLSHSLPDSLAVSVLTDRTVTVRASEADVTWELVLAVVLVVALIFVFLRSVPATLIPSLSVPLSIVGTFGVMHLAGFSLNNLTMMALTISTGFVVDDAIVMIENIERHIDCGEAPFHAAVAGSRELGFTIVSLTVSLLAVLIPLVFMGDIVGRLFREFALTLAVTIVISAVVSLTLVPMLCAYMLADRGKRVDSPTVPARQGLFDRLTSAYARRLAWTLNHQGVTLTFFALTVVLTVCLFLIVPKGFFPQQDTGLIQGVSEAHEASSFDAMYRHQEQLSRVIRADPAVASLSAFVGVDGVNATLNTSNVLINLKPESERDPVGVVMRRLQNATSRLPGVRLYTQAVQDLNVEDHVSKTQYQIAVGTADEEVLRRWVPQLVKGLAHNPDLADVTSDLQANGMGAYLDIDRNTAGRLGITAAAIDAILYDAFGQRQVSTIFTEANDYRVILEVDPPMVHGLGALSRLFVPSLQNANQVQQVPGALGSSSASALSQGGATQGATPGVSTQLNQAARVTGQVRLDSLVTLTQKATPLVTHHLGQFPAATVSFNLAPGVSLGSAIDGIERTEKSMAMPDSLDVAFLGAAAAFRASRSGTLWLVGAAILCMYIVLGVLYESFIHPITILSTLPSATLGALLALLLPGGQLDVIALIGIILLIGIVKKNAIMMVDFALTAERHRGMSSRDAIHEACLARFRPIMMTTFAALLGALPLMLASGVGAELRRPLGLVIVSGMLVSQVLTLFTTPVIYLVLSRLPFGSVRRRGVRLT